MIDCPVRAADPALRGARLQVSRVEAGGVSWNLVSGGQGPLLLLLHGTGSASGSWRGLLPTLAAEWTVLAPDLPGHGGSSSPRRAGMGLEGMATALAALCQALGRTPRVAIGHSAGAALACQAALEGLLPLERVVAINGALLPPLHMPLEIFGPLARVVASLPMLPGLLARRAREPAAVARLIGGTGSQLDADGLAFYRALLQDPGHVAAALRMMALWDLPALARRLPRLAARLDLMVADGDRAIPPGEALRLRAILPTCRIWRLAGLGHLAHEENPGVVLGLLRRVLADGLGAAAAAPCVPHSEGELP